MSHTLNCFLYSADACQLYERAVGSDTGYQGLRILIRKNLEYFFRIQKQKNKKGSRFFVQPSYF